MRSCAEEGWKGVVGEGWVGGYLERRRTVSGVDEARSTSDAGAGRVFGGWSEGI